MCCGVVERRLAHGRLGYEGARMEYDFHRYEIDWTPTMIKWLIDGRPVHYRRQWNPTPIPHLPMQFHVNVWHSRSTALAGELTRAKLPAHAELRRIEIHA